MRHKHSYNCHVHTTNNLTNIYRLILQSTILTVHQTDRTGRSLLYSAASQQVHSHLQCYNDMCDLHTDKTFLLLYRSRLWHTFTSWKSFLRQCPAICPQYLVTTVSLWNRGVQIFKSKPFFYLCKDADSSLGCTASDDGHDWWIMNWKLYGVAGVF